MRTATYIEQLKVGWIGDARLYKLDSPLEGYDYVVVSAVIAYSGPKTLIFGSDCCGRVDSYSDLDGSFRGKLDHREALNNAGYTIA